MPHFVSEINIATVTLTENAVCLLGTAAFCSFRIYSHYVHESEQEEIFEKIAEVVEQAQTGESETTDVLLTEGKPCLRNTASCICKIRIWSAGFRLSARISTIP